MSSIESCKYFFTCELLIIARLYLLSHKAEFRQLSVVNGGVVKMHLYYITENLAVIAPHCRVMIHVQHRIFLLECQRVTDTLHIRSEEFYVVCGYDVMCSVNVSH